MSTDASVESVNVVAEMRICANSRYPQENRSASEISDLHRWADEMQRLQAVVERLQKQARDMKIMHGCAIETIGMWRGMIEQIHTITSETQCIQENYYE